MRQCELAMQHSEDPSFNGWIPSWKRLGFQLTGPTPSSYPQYYKRYYPNPPWYQQNNSGNSTEVNGPTLVQSDHGDQKCDKQKKRKFNQTTLSQDFDGNLIESSRGASESKVKRKQSKLDRQQEAIQTSSTNENLTAENVCIQFNGNSKLRSSLTISGVRYA